MILRFGVFFDLLRSEFSHAAWSSGSSNDFTLISLPLLALRRVVETCWPRIAAHAGDILGILLPAQERFARAGASAVLRERLLADTVEILLVVRDCCPRKFTEMLAEAEGVVNQAGDLPSARRAIDAVRARRPSPTDESCGDPAPEYIHPAFRSLF
mmetsp:Transcript_20565/g.54856  ORF Transcript_20565/g.54856 Transcript_20565/m.54856 type:complete len:156 (-) Transcript_20565:52-519(-)